VAVGGKHLGGSGRWWQNLSTPMYYTLLTNSPQKSHDHYVSDFGLFYGVKKNGLWQNKT
jgi:hypothetical protein